MDYGNQIQGRCMMTIYHPRPPPTKISCYDICSLIMQDYDKRLKTLYLVSVMLKGFRTELERLEKKLGCHRWRSGSSPKPD